MDQDTRSAQRETDWQDALIVEIAALAREFAEQFAEEDAEDLAQDVVLECLMLLRENRWPGAESLPSLLNRIVDRRAFDRDEREQNAAEREEDYGPDSHPADRTWMDPLQTLENNEVMAACRDALRQLSPTSARVYTVVRRDGLSRSEAAAELGISVDAVGSHLRRAECAIRAELLALDLMPNGTLAPIGMLLDAQAQVPAVRKRRAQATRRAERAAELRRQTEKCVAELPRRAETGR
jgi:RNA polymerase sigma factor (sigma-70 family)